MNIFGRKITTKAALLFVIAYITCLSSLASAQVSIAPTALFFDNQNRFQSLTISNGGQQAQEISITSKFAYAASRNGNLVFVKDSTLAKKKSISNWIKVFPKNFTLQAQERQIVRFVVRPPNNLETGGYWARVQIQSNPVSPPIESVAEDQVGAQINLVVNQIINAFYHTPNAQTIISAPSVSFTQVDSTDTGTVSLSMEQTGDAPFVGSISFSLVDQEGNTVYQTRATTSVFTSLTRNFTIDLTDVKPGQYQISGRIISERRDISQENLLQIEPVNFEKKVLIE
ncbi:hypothetical protein [Fodinibius saliphilus]|uniref:hypothetical protein n=1 Tax=Fodinibius saliphilus TaxID=1920650 RepID=UPI001109DBA9|nr:hypothetical protein [Fodinibius saliphilus]